jgi:glyoxylase-like metal-dependent hydrolase (beta-lactamase superfamily II)
VHRTTFAAGKLRAALIMLGGLVLAATLVGTTAFAQNRPAAANGPRLDFSKVQEISTDLGHGLYMITGAGGNTTLVVGTDGLIVVDAQFAPVYPKLKARIAELSSEPVKYLINTHYHGDHTGGNAEFARDGAVIVAQVNVVKRLRSPPPGPNGQPGQPAPAAALPTKTYTNRMTLSVGGQTAQLIHVADAHTDGDTIVYFPAANVVSTGDVVSSQSYPNIDVAVGGSIDGMIRGCDEVLKLGNDQTKIVPGHGHLTDKAGVRVYRAMLMTARRLIAREIAEGKTEDQVIADMPLAELDKQWAVNGGPFAQRFPGLVYRSLKKS